MSDQVLQAEPGDEGRRRILAGTASEEEPLATILLDPRHRVADFNCKQSDGVQNFFRNEAGKFKRLTYCNTFVLENPEDPSHVWGFYTLAAASIDYDDISGSQKRKVPGHMPVPVARIGFMGRDDAAPKGAGKGLLLDAARRVSRNPDIAAWGIVLEPKPDRPKLIEWYSEIGFQWCNTTDRKDKSMWVPLRRLLTQSS